MLEGRATIQDTDMPVKMQRHAMSSACEALDLFDVLDCRNIAAHIKNASSCPLLSSSCHLIFSHGVSLILVGGVAGI
ncbi:hypothetical protein Cni_G10899 [Canna indica]|uniref:Dynein light chain n=1 Tax=Canna indica TaxID=4628 RepID=A0AAQ3K6U6_9LILI|nr:hypothetical protein Cni_G10899 [Canna indica]